MSGADGTTGFYRGFLVGLSVSLMLAACLVGWSLAFAAPPTAALRFQRETIRTARAVWGTDAPTAVFAGQIHQESGWNPSAISRTGAQGMAQFMPATSKWIGSIYPDLVYGTPSDPSWSIRAMIRYDRWLWDRVKADTPCDRIGFSLSGYNGGLGYVYRRQKLSSKPGVCMGATCSINPGIAASNQRENQDYPARILLRHQPIYADWGNTLCLP